ncbi:4583_t:CDS:2, partial [Racocetra fulgida]
APHDYLLGEEVKVYVNSLTPLMGSQQLKSLIPYDYYYKPFHFCAPENPQSQSESLDGLPAASKKLDVKAKTIFNSIGFELGDSMASFINPPLHNHYDIEIQYHKQEGQNKYRVVGVIVSPTSVNSCATTSERLILDEKKDNLVHYTYRVVWTVHISRYNQIEAQEDVQEDFGWKLVHGDIFRTPAN